MNISTSDWASISVLKDCLSSAISKTDSVTPDSFGDKLFRLKLLFSLKCRSSSVTKEFLEEVCLMMNTYEKDSVDRKNAESGFNVVKFTPYSVVS
jgi:hypothetical protein